MLTAKRTATLPAVFARDSEKADGPFMCPGCSAEVILHKGNIKIHHFKHKPPMTCARGEGESLHHLIAKLAIYDALMKEHNVSGLALEKDFGVSVADVFAVISGVPVALEIQRSSLSTAEIARRTVNYRQLGIAVLWIALHKPELLGDKYNPNAWEKWCHAAYFGRAYYWVGGQSLLPVHFGEYMLHVKSTEWYESGGEHKSAGGYDRSSKRYRKPNPGTVVLISQSFSATDKAPYEQGTVNVPACRLYVDRLGAWWKKRA